VKQAKLYLYDTGLACTLLGIDAAAQLESHYLRGALFEDAVILEKVGPREARITSKGNSQLYNKSVDATYYLYFRTSSTGYGLAVEKFGDGSVEYEWGTFTVRQ
jgi:hypothetical protein